MVVELKDLDRILFTRGHLGISRPGRRYSHRASRFVFLRRKFSTMKGQPLKPSYVRTLLPRLADKVGAGKRVHPHGLRHTLAYELMMEGVPVPII